MALIAIISTPPTLDGMAGMEPREATWWCEALGGADEARWRIETSSRYYSYAALLVPELWAMQSLREFSRCKHANTSCTTTNTDTHMQQYW
jgi:hypothetical protein